MTGGLLLLDFKDLRAITQYIGDNAKSFQNQYGNISKRLGRGYPAWTAVAGATGAALLWRTDAGHQNWMRTDASSKRDDQHPQRREALPDAQTVRRQPAVDALRTVRTVAGSGRSGETKTGVLLR